MPIRIGILGIPELRPRMERRGSRKPSETSDDDRAVRQCQRQPAVGWGQRHRDQDLKIKGSSIQSSGGTKVRNIRLTKGHRWTQHRHQDRWHRCDETEIGVREKGELIVISEINADQVSWLKPMSLKWSGPDMDLAGNVNPVCLRGLPRLADAE